jgi:hypothetical protein
MIIREVAGYAGADVIPISAAIAIKIGNVDARGNDKIHRAKPARAMNITRLTPNASTSHPDNNTTKKLPTPRAEVIKPTWVRVSEKLS